MPRTITEKTKNKLVERLEQVECKLISIETGRMVNYLCSCGNTSRSHISNLLRVSWKGTCAKCSNQKSGNLNTFEEVKKDVEKYGIILPDQPYVNNKTKLEYLCPHCGEIAHMSVCEIRRGRLCENCNKERAGDTNEIKYGARNPFQSEICKEKIKDTHLKKRGVSHHMKLKETISQVIETNMERYGYKFAFHSEESKEKGRATCKERYGSEFPMQVKELRDKMKESCRKNLGVDYPFQSPEFLEKVFESFYNKYGVKKPSQVPEFFEKIVKSSHSKKLYTFPSGRIEYVMGYEPFCLTYLLTMYEEDDIVVCASGMPPIFYISPVDNDIHRYYPDAYIISTNTLIEVKSTYTYFKERQKNDAKFKGVVNLGINLHLYVYAPKGKLLCEKYYPSDGTSMTKTVHDESYESDDEPEEEEIDDEDNMLENIEL